MYMKEELLWNNSVFPRLLFENARDAILVTQKDGTIVAANPMASRFFGYSHEELLGYNQHELLEEAYVADKKLRKKEAPLIETKGFTKNYEKIPLEVSIADFKFDSEWYQVYILRDISSRKAVEEEMYRLANIDPLTNLPNRRYMRKRIELERDRAERSNKEFSFIMCDIDDFKQFNDNYGHDCGDYILTEIAEILQDSIRKQDIVSRWGGEEFLFLLPETDRQGAVKTAEKIRKKIETRRFSCEDQVLTLTMTFGVARCLWDEDVEERIKKADTALLLGKNKGKNHVVYQ